MPTRSSKCTTKFCNKRKLFVLNTFLVEYRVYVRKVIDFYYDVLLKKDFEKYINLTTLSFYPNAEPDMNLDFIDTIISGKARKAAMTLAWRMIKTRDLIKARKQLYVINKLKSENKDHSNIVLNYNLPKPIVPAELPCQLDSNTTAIHFENRTTFDLVIDFRSIFAKKFLKETNFLEKNKMTLVFKSHKQLNKLINQKDKLLNYILLKENSISLYFNMKTKKSQGQKKLGIDQGVKKMLSVVDSNGTSSTSKDDPHGHSLESIMKKFFFKKKGSNNYKKAQAHRTNYINYSINLLLSDNQDVSAVHLEKIRGIFNGRRRSKTMSRWVYAEIETAFKNKCELLGVTLELENSPFKSQRCAVCGFVHSKNRKKEEFLCQKCGHIDDADLNSAQNQLQELYDFTYEDLASLKGCNRKNGFYWNQNEFTKI